MPRGWCDVGEQTNQPLTGDQIEQVIRLSLPTVREAVRAEIAPLHSRVESLEKDWGNLRRGWRLVTALVTAAGTLLSGTAWDMVKGKS